MNNNPNYFIDLIVILAFNSYNFIKIIFIVCGNKILKNQRLLCYEFKTVFFILEIMRKFHILLCRISKNNFDLILALLLKI